MDKRKPKRNNMKHYTNIETDLKCYFKSPDKSKLYFYKDKDKFRYLGKVRVDIHTNHGNDHVLISVRRYSGVHLCDLTSGTPVFSGQIKNKLELGIILKTTGVV